MKDIFGTYLFNIILAGLGGFFIMHIQNPDISYLALTIITALFITRPRDDEKETKDKQNGYDK